MTAYQIHMNTKYLKKLAKIPCFKLSIAYKEIIAKPYYNHELYCGDQTPMFTIAPIPPPLALSQFSFPLISNFTVAPIPL